MNKILINVLTLAIFITVIGAIYIAIVPGFTEKEVIENYEQDIETVEFSVPREPTEIESLINNLILNNPANKGQYKIHPDKIDEVHVCMNMAVEQTEWISENYGYETGIVMLWNKYLGDNHAQTWVDINETRYVIDSTSNYYWTVDKHAVHWGDRYKTQFTNVKKGLELEKENNEWLNNKDK